MIQSVFFFPNGNAAVFDENGQQMPELQQSWLIVFLGWLQTQSGQPMDTIKEIVLPNGDLAKPFKTSEGSWNWDVYPR